MISPPFYLRRETTKMILIRIALCIMLNSKQLTGKNNPIDPVFELRDLNPERELAFEIFLLTELLMCYNNFSLEV